MKNLLIVFLFLAFLPMGFAQVQKLHVADHRDLCPGVGIKKCYLVREHEDREWEYSSEPINDFHYVPGFEYTLLVKKSRSQDSEWEYPTVHYSLIKILDKKKSLNPVTSEPPYADMGKKHDRGALGLGISGRSDSAAVSNVPFIALTGKWHLTELNARNVSDSSKITLHFSPKNKYGGNAGCNSYFGSYTPNADSIRFSFGPMTRMSCSPGRIMHLEMEYLKTLRRAATFRKTDTSLEIIDRDGNTVARFEPAEK